MSLCTGQGTPRNKGVLSQGLNTGEGGVAGLRPLENVKGRQRGNAGKSLEIRRIER